MIRKRGLPILAHCLPVLMMSVTLVQPTSAQTNAWRSTQKESAGAIVHRAREGAQASSNMSGRSRVGYRTDMGLDVGPPTPGPTDPNAPSN